MTSEAPAQTPAIAPIVTPAPPHFTMPGMNVYRRFDPAKTAKMVDFYEKLLGLKPLTPIQLGANQQMLLFGIGRAQIKLSAELKQGRKYRLGSIHEATGIRLFAITYPDERSVTDRFKAAGYPPLSFRDLSDGRQAALVQDPGGFTIELIIDPDRPARGVDVGVNVSDLQKSRAFYRDFVGLQELPPVRDDALGVTKYPFRNGETTISLWSIGKSLPADTGSAGIQYVIDNVEAVNARALERNVTIEEPLGSLPGFDVRFVWLNDPDGVTNYFAQTAPRAP